MNTMRPPPSVFSAARSSWTYTRCTGGGIGRQNVFVRAPQRPQFMSSIPARASADIRPRRAPDLRSQYKKRNKDLLYYTLRSRFFFSLRHCFLAVPVLIVHGVNSLGITTLTLSYASVPLYRAICQRTGYGGTPITDQTRFTPEKLTPVGKAKRIRVTFSSSVSDVLEWKFTPQQREVRVLPGETALAFYTATNMSKDDIIGIATYSVTPGQVAPYFSKIQCFCFEEQKLNAGETVDMPVFFFIDPEFYEDPQMKGIDTVTLSYTFFSWVHPGGSYFHMPNTKDRSETRRLWQY